VDEAATHHITTPRTARVLTLGAAREADEVWFLLHGYAQTADEMLALCRTLAGERRMLVAPQALSRFYRRGAGGPTGASWMTRDDREQEISDYVAYLDRVAAFVERDLGCASTERIALGFSQGAATAWRWAVLGTTSLQRLIAWGGGVPGDLDLASRTPKLAATRIEFVRGSRDESYSAAALSGDRERLARAGLAATVRAFEGGHELPDVALAELGERRES
jgi:predicted esterase